MNTHFARTIMILPKCTQNFSFLFTRIEILVRVKCIFVPFFFLSVIQYFAFQCIYKNFVPEKFLSKGIFSFSKIKFYLCFLRSSKGITHTSIKYSNKYSKLKQSENLTKFYFYYNFYFYDMLLNIFFFRARQAIPSTKITR